MIKAARFKKMCNQNLLIKNFDIKKSQKLNNSKLNYKSCFKV